MQLTVVRPSCFSKVGICHLWTLPILTGGQTTQPSLRWDRAEGSWSITGVRRKESVRVPGGNQENVEVVTSELGLERFIHDREMRTSHTDRKEQYVFGKWPTAVSCTGEQSRERRAMRWEKGHGVRC